MDERVLKALKQWPDVPDAYGWLALDRRGRWLLRGELISNYKVREFINRNYVRTEAGSYAFQNGPQRVHVDLEITPFVARCHTDDSRLQLDLHTGQAAGTIRAAVLDTAGNVVLDTEHGAALIHDQDLHRILARLTGPDGKPLDDSQLELALDAPDEHDLHLQLGDARQVPVEALGEQSLEQRFDFIAHPAEP